MEKLKVVFEFDRDYINGVMALTSTQTVSPEQWAEFTTNTVQGDCIIHLMEDDGKPLKMALAMAAIGIAAKNIID